MKKPAGWQVRLILAIGVLMTSTSAIFIRLSFAITGHSGISFSIFLAAARLIVTAILLIPSWRNFRPKAHSPQTYYYAIAAGICLAFHFVTWISSLSFTSIAAATTLVTINPIWVSLLCWLWWGEKPHRWVIAGIIIALLGGVLIAFGDSNASQNHSNPLLGDALALLGSLLASLYLLFGRESQKQGLGIGQYILIAYTTAALCLLPLPLFSPQGYWDYPPLVYLYIVLMAIFPQMIGHTSINWSINWISPTIVTLAILFEPLGSSFLGWLIFQEIPPLTVLGGGLILLLGVAIAAIGDNTHQKTGST
ncbi:MAG: EamA family transporter [Snowella sp.]|nr:MAG: EamA family transporter [Snowella sp.]